MPHPALSYPLNWSKFTPKTLPRLLDEGLKLAKARLAQIKAVPLERATYENTVGRLPDFGRELEITWALTMHLAAVDDSPQIRKVMQKYLPQVSDFVASISVDAKLWERVKKVSKSAEAKRLPAVHKRHLELVVTDFKHNGAQLPPAAKKDLVRTKKRILELGEEFSKKVLDSTKVFEKHFPEGAEKTQLRGLTPTMLAMGRADAAARKKKGYVYTLLGPSFAAIFTYADDAALRKEFAMQARKIGRTKPYDTTQIIRQILAGRQRLAKILGLKNFAYYPTYDRMLNSPVKINSFLGTLFKRVRKAARQDFDKIAKFKKTLGGRGALETWDTAYYIEKLTQKELHLEEEALRPYFEFNHVRESLFALSGKLWGVRLREVKNHKAWHPEVKYYEVLQGNHVLGGFYTDFFPRTTKRSGAWKEAFLYGLPMKGGKLSPHVCVICGNFTPPSGKLPALLTHEEVTTFYHEFGHLMHAMLSEVPVTSLSGTRVPWDFVELPSQFLENYCYDEQYLKTLSKHYKTQEALPAKTIRQLAKSRKFLVARMVNRQLELATLDMYLHTQTTLPRNIETTLKKVLRPFKMPFPSPSPTPANTFSHIWHGGYEAGYYSYKWSEVLEADVWEYFKKHGALSRQVGERYRRTILSKGNSKPVDELYKDMMGRPPRMEAYLKRLTA